jgi:hypothetical protein
MAAEPLTPASANGAPPPSTPPEETPEEQEAFLASIRAYRDEIDRATGSGKYATKDFTRVPGLMLENWAD